MLEEETPPEKEAPKKNVDTKTKGNVEEEVIATTPTLPPHVPPTVNLGTVTLEDNVSQDTQTQSAIHGIRMDTATEETFVPTDIQEVIPHYRMMKGSIIFVGESSRSKDYRSPKEKETRGREEKNTNTGGRKHHQSRRPY